MDCWYGTTEGKNSIKSTVVPSPQQIMSNEMIVVQCLIDHTNGSTVIITDRVKQLPAII